uniref:Uncharacterized protein n=1 Tax=Romanomermis culicivorax TaxID=13658 RepID=A0A915JF86_ROMCU
MLNLHQPGHPKRFGTYNRRLPALPPILCNLQLSKWCHLQGIRCHQ